MANLYQGIPELEEGAAANERRRKIAEMLMAQSQEPVQPFSQAGRYVVPMSWTQGLAQALKAYYAGKGMKKADKAEAEMAEKFAKRQKAAETLYEQQRGGVPGAQLTSARMSETGAQLPPTGEIGGLPADPEGAARGAIMNPYATPGLRALAGIDLERASRPPEAYTLGPGDARYVGGEKIAERDPALGKKGTEDVSIGNGLWQAFEVKPDGTVDMGAPIGRPFAKKPGANETNVNVGQEKAFDKALGEALGKDAVESWHGAKDAVQVMENITEARGLLDSGMITGFGAEYLVKAGQALRRIGFNAAEGDLENTQAYAAWLGNNVGKIIKQFGAGTGLSDADREYAEKIVGGKVTLDEAALRKILELNERASRNIIDKHNKTFAGVESVVPLRVEYSATGTGGAPPAGATILRYDKDGNALQ